MARALHKWLLNAKRSQNNEPEPEQNTDRRVWRSEIRAGSSPVRDRFETDRGQLEGPSAGITRRDDFVPGAENPAGWFGRSEFVRTACPILPATPATFAEEPRKTPQLVNLK